MSTTIIAGMPRVQGTVIFDIKGGGLERRESRAYLVN